MGTTIDHTHTFPRRKHVNLQLHSSLIKQCAHSTVAADHFFLPLYLCRRMIARSQMGAHIRSACGVHTVVQLPTKQTLALTTTFPNPDW